MANSKKAQTKVVGTTIQAMVNEGKALKEIWEKRLTSQRRTFTSDTNAKGFDTRLGKLLQQLKASSSMDSGQISRQVLTDHGLHIIDRRRRSEALWFVENEVKCREFIKNSKKGFTSLTALQKAMKDATAKAEVIKEAADKVSNVGQSDEVNDTGWIEVDKGTYSLGNTRTAIVDAIFAHCNDHQIDIETIIADLQSKAALANKVAA
jgi:hypothetical protein